MRGRFDGIRWCGIFVISVIAGAALVASADDDNPTDPAAMNRLGDQYYDGRGVTKDYNQAMIWYLQAAAGGNAAGMANVGYLYGNGLGVKRDYARER